MKKSDLVWLEKLFAAEIEGLPFQSRSKRLPELEREGLVEHVTVTLPGRFPVEIRGWILTHKGRIIYCESCADQEARP